MPRPPVHNSSRECLNASGKPKMIFDSETKAILGISTKMGKYALDTYGVYQCSKLHWHIGKKERRTIFPSSEEPCGTLGCQIVVPHHPKNCGPVKEGFSQ